MPEMLEAEMARACIEEGALGRTIDRVIARDRWYLKRDTTAAGLRTALEGRSFTAARRIGKQLLLDTSDDGPTLGLHLGMSGRVIVDGVAAGDPLLYTSNRDERAWYRFSIVFVDGGVLALRDPRRLGGVELEPDEARFGPDASTLRRADLDRVLRSAAPIKAVLMNQRRIAGLGNLLTDEVLWRAGIDPRRPADELTKQEAAALQRSIRSTIRTLGRRGGSHMGDHMVGRYPGGTCPRDGNPFAVQSVGGRTTYWCPKHQV